MKQNYASLFSFLKKSIVALAVGTVSMANAQVANYTFSQSMGTYTPLVGATLMVSAVGDSAQAPTFNDDTNYPLLNLGFTFIYNGAPYTQIGVSDNGFIRMGVQTTTSYAVLSAQTNVIAAFNEDLLGNSTTHQLRYQVSGTPGSQVFTIEWFNWGFFNVIGNELNFQIKLYEATGEIQIVYEPVLPSITGLMKVGINGTPVTDFNSRTTTTDWTATTPSPLNTSSCTFNATVFPPAGLTFSWLLAPIDMGATALVSPLPDLCYSATETVTVRIRNFGSQTIDYSLNPCTISCSVAGPIPQTFPDVILSSGTLAPIATQDVIISTTCDMSLPGTYTFTASTTTPSDGNAANDNMTAINIATMGTASAQPSNDSVCLGSSATLILTGYNGTIQWQSWDGSSWINETGPGNNTANYVVTPTVNTDYRALICGTHITSTLSITVIVVAPPTTTGDTRCGYGTVNLSASGTGNMNWYDNPTGGTSLFTGNNYSPTVSTTDTFYVEAMVGTPTTSPLTTTFAAGNGQSGNMFNITALNTVTITHFDGHVQTGTNNFKVWYRPGSYIGFQNDSSTWILLGTATGVPAAGLGNPTPIPINFAVTIPAGQTYGFYVTTTTTGTVRYTNGTGVDNVYAQDANIQFREGHGGTYFNLAFSPRVFNGNIYYESGCGSATRTPVIALVTVADSVIVTASTTSICGLPASTLVTLNAASSNPSYNYTWVGADLITTTGPSVTALPNATTTYIVTGDDGTCADTAAITVMLTAPPPATATATPMAICLGQPSLLSTPPGNITYTVNPIPFAPLTFTGNEGPIGDDVLMPPNPQPGLPIGFTFNFFGNDYTLFKISTNGNIQFGPTFTTTFTTGTIPTATGLNNYIGIPWCDMFVDTVLGQHIKWATLGTAPNRMLVVSYDSVRAFSGGGFHKSQVILYEGTNCVEIHAAFSTNTTINKVMGIENQNGSQGAAAPGRNNVNFNFNTPEAWAFCPVSPYTFVWTPPTWLNNPNIYNPVLTPLAVGSFTYTVTTTDINSGCTSTSSVTVSVVNVPPAPATSNLTRCGTGTVQLTATAGGPGTLQWFDVPVGGTPFATGSPVTSPVISFTDTFYVEEYDGNCPGPRIPVIVTVTPADTIIATSTSNPMCAGAPVTITISSINPGYSYAWSPAVGLSSTTGSPVTANPPFTTLYTINAIDGAGCETSTSINLTVNPSPVVAAVANPVMVCSGTPTQLDINNTSNPIEFTVGTGTITNTGTGFPAPYGNFWWGARHQMLITQAELLAAGITAGNLYSLGFDVVNVNSCPPLVNFEIKMMNTTATNMTAWLTGLGTVYLNPLYTPVVGWNTHTFSTPFNWDGVSNIVIETCFNNSSFLNNGNCSFRQTATPYVSTRRRNADVATVCTNLTAVSGTHSQRPNMRFGVPSDFDYLWTPSTALSSDTISNPVASPTTTITYTVAVTDNYWNCTTTSTITINVNPLPVVVFSPLNSICIDGSPLPLSGGTPTGGIYSGPGVSGNIFYPTVAGLGTHTIVYVYTDGFGCMGTDSTTITVHDLPIVTLPTFPDACVNATPINLTTGLPLGGTYSGPGVTAGTFNPNVAGTGIHSIIYTYTDANNCTNSALRNIVVNDSPVANAGPDTTGNTILNGSATGGTPPYTYIWSPCLDLLNCNTLSPFANPQVNTYYVLYVVDANGCYSTDTVLVTSTIGIAPMPVENSGLLVYPNPAAGLFNLLFLNPNDKAEVTITNSIGQQVFSSGTFTAPALPYQVNLSNQPDGIYVMHVKYRDRIIASRLVLNK